MDIAEHHDTTFSLLLQKKLTEEVVHSEGEAYELYRSYGAAVGFKIIRGNQLYFSGTKTIRTKSYNCANKNPKTRTGCKASVMFVSDSIGNWRVSRFLDVHNHAMGPPYITTLPTSVAQPPSPSCVPSSSHVPCNQLTITDINPARHATRCKKRKYSEHTLNNIPKEPLLLPIAADCKHSNCKCKRFYLEPSGLCCADGKVSLISYPMPTEIRDLLMGSDAASVNFRANIRTYNNKFAFTSLGVKYDHELTKNLKGMYTFRVQGQFYHFLPALKPTGAALCGIQIYYYDSHEEIIEHFPTDEKFLPSNVNLLQKIFADNPYTKFFKRVYAEPLPTDCKIILNGSPLLDQRLYNLPTTEQIAAIITESDDVSLDRTPHILVETTSGTSQIVKQSYGCCDPLQYPLLFPYGEPGWHLSVPKIGTVVQTPTNPFYYPNNSDDRAPTPDAETSSAPAQRVSASTIENVGTFNSIPDAPTLLQREAAASRRAVERKGFVTARQFYSYKFQMRDADESLLLHSLRLFQQFVVNMYVKIETQRLDYIRKWQADYRIELRTGVVDAVAAGDTLGGSIGRKSILPSSFIGGPRDMRRRYFDAMSLVQKYGKPDIFITMTCNPKWPEIRQHLKWHETPFDRPDLLTRVFRAKLEVFKEEIFKKQLFGEVESYVYVVEFQKRGMPHAHFLIILKDRHKPATPEAYDRIVCAEIPDENQFPNLHRLVIKHMIHGPCGKMNSDRVCMRGHVCKDKYPKPFTDYTVHAEDSYPSYRRRNNGRTVMVIGKELDNRWVVPYNPRLLAMFDCHINVEICSTVKLVKYMYKYVYKGLSMVNFFVRVVDEQSKVDEIKEYQDARWLGPPEATWRIYGFPLSHMTPSVYTLQVHLEGNPLLSFRPTTNLQSLVDDPDSSRTMLTEFFEMNARNPRIRGLQLLYKDFPQFFVWHSTPKKWTHRKRGEVIGRPVTVSPKEGERYYLRLLLCNVKAPSSFQELRTVNGQVFSKFRDAALQLGLLHSDKYVEDTIMEASLANMPVTLRYLFATALVYCNPDNPHKLFNLFFESLSADFRYQLQLTDLADEYLQVKTLEAIDISLQHMGHSIQEFIDLPLTRGALYQFTNTKEIDFERNITVDEEERELYLLLNDNQKVAYDMIIGAITSNSGESFFIDGPGGTGKTFLYRCLLAALRSAGHIALAVATSGVAASILPGGRTAHSRFGIPIDFTRQNSCTVSKQSSTGKLIAEARLIIWDEAATANKEALEAFNNLLKDIMSNSAPLGGKTVVFGGDFRQTLPVLENATHDTLIKRSILGTSLWPHLIKMRLTVNMRAQLDPFFSEFILAVGEGLIETDHEKNIVLPSQIVLPYENFEKSFARLVHCVYEDLSQFLLNPSTMVNRCILSPTNESVDDINSRLIEQFPGDSIIYTSVDKALDARHQGDFEEFLNTLKPNGMPPHKLVLKKGCPVILLRNLNPTEGLCNGTRMICKELRSKSLHVEISTGRHAGQCFFLPMIPLNSPDNEKNGIPFSRTQFPVKLCFSMTINKAQGQTLDYVGIYLRQPVFSHGQLYVALSRARTMKQVSVLIAPALLSEKKNDCKTRNIVYNEVFHLATSQDAL